MFLIQNMRIADAYELAARNDPSAPLADLDRWGPNPLWHRPPDLPKFARVGGPEYVYSIK